MVIMQNLHHSHFLYFAQYGYEYRYEKTKLDDLYLLLVCSTS